MRTSGFSETSVRFCFSTYFTAVRPSYDKVDSTNFVFLKHMTGSRSDRPKLRSRNSSVISVLKVSSCAGERVDAVRESEGEKGGGVLRRAHSRKGRRAVSLPLWILLDPVGAHCAGQSVSQHVFVDGECIVAGPWRISVSACLARFELHWRFC